MTVSRGWGKAQAEQGTSAAVSTPSPSADCRAPKCHSAVSSLSLCLPDGAQFFSSF